MTEYKIKILAVDDEVRILRLIKSTLEIEDYQVVTATDGEMALEMFDKEKPALIILDIMMSRLDGYQVCQQIRQYSSVPIIMLTSKDSEEEKVIGLNYGADDYITKPFGTQELLARVKAVLRRSSLSEITTESVFESGGLAIDFAHHCVNVAGKPVDLTATEFQILRYLAQNAGFVLTTSQILRKVWGEEYENEVHILRVNISRLRQKLNDNSDEPKYITTRPGIGYSLIKTRAE